MVLTKVNARCQRLPVTLRTHLMQEGTAGHRAIVSDQIMQALESRPVCSTAFVYGLAVAYT